jgi:hypothetical protein
MDGAPRTGGRELAAPAHGPRKPPASIPFAAQRAQVISRNSCACVSIAFAGITRTFSP